MTVKTVIFVNRHFCFWCPAKIFSTPERPPLPEVTKVTPLRPKHSRLEILRETRSKARVQPLSTRGPESAHLGQRGRAPHTPSFGGTLTKFVVFVVFVCPRPKTCKNKRRDASDFVRHFSQKPPFWFARPATLAGQPPGRQNHLAGASQGVSPRLGSKKTSARSQRERHDNDGFEKRWF